MILDLGLIDYEECYCIQKDMVMQRKLCKIDDTLILAEHNSIFTIGRTGSRANILVDDNYLGSRGIKVLSVDRGGDITFHGEGQLVLYPIIALNGKYRDLHLYMRNLEDVAIKLLKRYSLTADRCPGHTGVWVSGMKVASIGVGASNWVTYHGLSINIKTDLDFFDMIYPCGIKDAGMTSLRRLIGKDIAMDEVKREAAADFKSVFNAVSESFASAGALGMSACFNSLC